MPVVIDVEEVEREIARAKREREEPSGDRRICVCGHPWIRHREVLGRMTCRPTRLACNCAWMRPAVEAEDIRVFIFKSTGSKSQHALSKGVGRAMTNEQKVSWLIGQDCDLCNRTKHTYPVGINGSPTFFRYEPYNPQATLLVCEGCLRLVESGEIRSSRDLGEYRVPKRHR